MKIWKLLDVRPLLPASLEYPSTDVFNLDIELSQKRAGSSIIVHENRLTRRRETRRLAESMMGTGVSRQIFHCFGRAMAAESTGSYALLN